MKANRAARARADEGAAEVIGALILFGIFVGVIAILNVTAVPNAGRAAEQEHYEKTLSQLNGLQSEAETAGLPGNVGSTVARALDLSPARDVGQDFFSYFMATPARASGELTFEPDHGNMTIFHYKSGNPNAFYDIGSATARFPLGRITFDPHPVYRDEGIISLENAAIVATSADGAAMRFDPPISVSVAGDTTSVVVKTRVLNGTPVSIGGTAPVRTLLATEAATLASPANENAARMQMRLTTDHGAAWAEFLARICDEAGLTIATGYYVGLDENVDIEGGADRVTWFVNGTGSGNDMRLTTGLAVYGVAVS